MKPMIEAIIREYVNRNLYSKEIITQLINTIIIVVARNIAMFYLNKSMNVQMISLSIFFNISKQISIKQVKLEQKKSVSILVYLKVTWDVI